MEDGDGDGEGSISVLGSLSDFQQLKAELERAHLFRASIGEVQEMRSVEAYPLGVRAEPV